MVIWSCLNLLCHFGRIPITKPRLATSWGRFNTCKNDGPFKKDGWRQGHQLPQSNLKTPLLSFFEPRSTRNSRWSWLNLVKGGAWKEEFGACLKITDPHWLPRSAFCWWWGGAKPTKCDSFKRPDQQWKKDSPQHHHQPQKQYHHHNQYHTRLNQWIPIEYVQNQITKRCPIISHLSATRMLSLLLSSHFQFLAILLILLDGKRNPAPASMKPQFKKSWQILHINYGLPVKY